MKMMATTKVLDTGATTTVANISGDDDSDNTDDGHGGPVAVVDSLLGVVTDATDTEGRTITTDLTTKSIQEQLLAMTVAYETLKKQVQEQEQEQQQQQQQQEQPSTSTPTNTNANTTSMLVQQIPVPTTKRGYLFKWVDRSIGWGGTKWALRFVIVEKGRLAYYLNHSETSPRYVLSLHGLAVREDGHKLNKRYKKLSSSSSSSSPTSSFTSSSLSLWRSMTKSSSTTASSDDKGGKNNDTDEHQQPPFDEPGAYFFMFSIYQRPEDDDDDDHDHGVDIDDDNSDDENDDLSIIRRQRIVPLLTFSTSSLAERHQWMEQIQQACYYCETEQYRIDEIQRVAEFDQQVREQQRMAMSMPEAKEGTLPPLYFAPPPTTSTNTNTNTTNAFTAHTRQSSFVAPIKLQSKTNNNNVSHSTSTTNMSSSIRRSRSRGNIDSGTDSTNKFKGYPASKPMHRSSAPSYLSSDAPVQNYRGLLNLMVIILMVSNIRSIVTSIRNHGFLLNPYVIVSYIQQLPHAVLTDPDPWSHSPFILAFVLQLVFVIIAFVLELLLSQQKIPEKLGMLIHHINSHCALIIPTYIVWSFVQEPVDGVIILLHAATTWMKLVSYCLANEDYRISVRPSVHTLRRRSMSFRALSRSDSIIKNDTGSTNLTAAPVVSSQPKTSQQQQQQHDHVFTETSTVTPHEAALLALIDNLDACDRDIVYPQNITIGNLFYFWVCPSLTYQIAFPRTSKVRISEIIDIVVQMLVTFTLFSLVAAQLVQPALRGLVNELIDNNGIYTIHMLAEYWLRLSVATTYMWLLMFYLYFHLYLNLLAELLRFGDRVFYKDWWNSSEVSAFWRLWNLPVHYWLIRHLYFPCLRHRLSKTASTFVVFLVSAIMHEVLVSVPFHIIRPWSFIGMMGQIPLVAITKYLYRKYPGSSVGNMIFWLSFCVVGQPMAILFYTVDYNYNRLQSELLNNPSSLGGMNTTSTFRDEL